MNASQALSFRSPKKSSSFIESFLKPYRSIVPFIENDRLMADDIHASVAFLQTLEIDSEILFG
jgi:histidine ammonia-lyase